MKKNNTLCKIGIVIGVALIVYSCLRRVIYNFIFMGIGIAIIGIILETSFKKSKDTLTEDGKSRNNIEMYDERNILINAKSGETTNYIMAFFTLAALIIAKLRHVSYTGMIIILSLLILRHIISFITNKYYQFKM